MVPCKDFSAFPLSSVTPEMMALLYCVTLARTPHSGNTHDPSPVSDRLDSLLASLKSAFMARVWLFAFAA